MQVEKSRRRAFLMLAILALWAMVPVSACLGSSHPTGKHSCCYGVAQVCDSTPINASGSCCHVHRQEAAVVLIFPDAVVPLQTVAVLSHPCGLPAPSFTSIENQTALAPPSILSSVGNSILRI